MKDGIPVSYVFMIGVFWILVILFIAYPTTLILKTLLKQTYKAFISGVIVSSSIYISFLLIESEFFKHNLRCKCEEIATQKYLGNDKLDFFSQNNQRFEQKVICDANKCEIVIKHAGTYTILGFGLGDKDNYDFEISFDCQNHRVNYVNCGFIAY